MAGKKRGLTPGEKTLLQSVFGAAVDYDRIRLQDGAGANPIAMIALRNPKNWAITYRNTIHYNEGHFRDDFTAGDDRVHEGLLVHEVAHHGGHGVLMAVANRRARQRKIALVVFQLQAPLSAGPACGVRSKSRS